MERASNLIRLRDDFALAALNGLLASRGYSPSTDASRNVLARNMAEDAYALADAMLRERGRDREEEAQLEAEADARRTAQAEDAKGDEYDQQ